MSAARTAPKARGLAGRDVARTRRLLVPSMRMRVASSRGTRPPRRVRLDTRKPVDCSCLARGRAAGLARPERYGAQRRSRHQ